ncbi:MAG: hypothetical protein LUE29_06525, partial [Lachnospiraceae bacterium]|nr:hypothetical protein [Lachnospiraceae bacterium]
MNRTADTDSAYRYRVFDRMSDTDSTHRHRVFDRTADTDSAYRFRSSERTGRGRKKRTVGSAVWRGVIFGMVLCLLAELGTALGIPVVSCSKNVAKRISSVIPQESIEQVQNLIYRIAFGWTADSLPVCGCLFAAVAGAEEGAGDASVSGFTAGLWQVVTDRTMVVGVTAIKNDVVKSVTEENGAGNGNSGNDGGDGNGVKVGDDGNGGVDGNDTNEGEAG